MSAAFPVVVSFSLTMDLEPVIVALARQSHTEAGLKLDEAELKNIKERTARQLDEAHAVGQPELQKEIAKRLPAGAKLLSLSPDRKGLTVSSKTTLALDTPDLLAQIELPGATPGGPALRPFESFQVARSKGTLELRGTAPESPGGTLTLQLEAPAPIKSHNAARFEGRSLFWEATGAPLDVRVTWEV